MPQLSQVLAAASAQRRAQIALHASASAAHSRACSRADRERRPAPKWKLAAQLNVDPDTEAAVLKEEYETRKRDRLASDPEFAERYARYKRQAREQRDQVRENRHYAAAMAQMKGELPQNRRLRLLAIWGAIINLEQADKIDRVYLPQESRIANIKNRELCQGRVRGIGAAARRAGF